MSRRLPRHAVERLLSVGSEPEVEGQIAGFADLGRYRLISELGRGGMGRVYEAEDTQLRRRVALKLMPETVGLSEVMRRRFAREAQAVAKLSHPNIAAVFDATPDYIAMQLVRGCSIIEVSRADPRRLAMLIRDAAIAVQYAHDRGVVHRDLKPSNLMVEPAGESGSTVAEMTQDRVFVLDFGLAKETAIESSLSTSGSIVGTPSYMPPEQAEGRGRDVDERSDVYGLGATLYACLTGDSPFPGEDMLKVLRSVVEDEPRSPRIESDLDAIVLKCLAKEPDRRYRSARDLADDLSRWLDGEAVVAKPPSVAYRLRKFLGRRKALVRVGAIAVAVSLLVAAAILIPIQLELRGANRALGFSTRMENALADAELLFRSGAPERAESRLDGAIGDCRSFLSEYGDVAHVHYLHGRLLNMRGKRNSARLVLDHAIETAAAVGTPHAGAHLERGLILLAEYASRAALDSISDEDGETSQSSDPAEDALQLARSDLDLAARVRENLRLVDIEYALAELQRLDGNLALARDQLQGVLELDPTKGQAWLALSRLCFALGDEENGRRYALGAVDLHMGFAPAFLSRSEMPALGSGEDGGGELVLGVVARLEGLPWLLCDFTSALRRDRSSGVSTPDSRLEAIVASAALGREGDVDAALRAWELAITNLDALIGTVPNLLGARLNRAVCRAEREQLLFAVGRNLDAIAAHRGAMADCDEVIRAAPSFAPAYFDRGLLRSRQGDRLMRFGRITPAIEEIEQAVADFDRAEQRGESGAGLYGERGRALELWAQMLAQQQQESERVSEMRQRVVQDYDRAVESDGEAWIGRMRRGLYRASRGDSEGGRADLEEVLRLAPAGWSERAICEARLSELKTR